MNRRTLLPVLLGLALLGVAPAYADKNGTTETTTESRSCSAAADNHYSAPKDTDCRNADGSFNSGGTYQSTKNTNDVRCGATNQQGPTVNGIRVYARGDANISGQLSVCSDGQGAAAAPVQGRAGLSGSQSEGLRTVVDGDKDNANETAQGYVVVQQPAGPGAPTYRCGDEYSQGGKADSDTPESRDTSGECGG